MFPSTGKVVMATIFWDLREILLINILAKRQTFLNRVKVVIIEKIPAMARTKVLVFHNNEAFHTSALFVKIMN